ncbi:MAG: methylmalonyl-CoA mutase [Nocardioides sp.]|nr:methylmalonyl-CoA mutase [Nocardioides sp.]
MNDDVAGGLEEPAELQPEQGDLRLAAPEDDWSQADWERAAAGVLRKSGRLAESDPDDAVWAALTRTTYDGIAIPPLGTRGTLDGLETTGRPGRVGGWDIRVRHTGDHAAAVDELANGATSLWVVADEVEAGELAGALEGVRLDQTPVVLLDPSLAHAEALVALAPLHPDSNLGATADDDLESFVRLARQAGIRAFVSDGTDVHERGASDGQELGWVLARGAELLRSLEDAGVGPDVTLDLVEIRLAATGEQFLTIAKMRAARRLWGRLAELCGVADSQTRIHAVTSRVMTSAYDVHTNMLRGTVAAFAAGVGGADAITVVPYDEPTGVVSPAARRIARNVSSLLIAESHVAAVADPAGGSYAIEKLTDDLCRVAWAELGRIDQDGFEAFDARVADVSARRDADVATRRRPIVGLSQFPNPADPVPECRNLVPRWGAAYEALRRDPAPAHVFLATMGPLAQHASRAAFATNLLAAGGVAVDVVGATSGVDDLMAAYDGQPVVCLAGRDAAYAEWGSEAAQALRGAGARHVIVVSTGSNGDRSSTDAPEWADDSCAPGVDAIAFLTRTREALR